MITLEEWHDHLKNEKDLYTYSGGTIIPYIAITAIYDSTHKMFRTGDGIWFRDIFKTEKECAEGVIEQLKEQYL